MNDHAKWLRKAAEEIRRDGWKGWGNTCSDAADELDRVYAEGGKVYLAGVADAFERELTGEESDYYLRRYHEFTGYNRQSNPDHVEALKRVGDRIDAMTPEEVERMVDDAD